MSLAEIKEQLLDTHAAIAQVERALADDRDSNDSGALLLTARSLAKRRMNLEATFLNEAKHQGEEVCSYRFLVDIDGAALSPLTGALGGFQKLVTVVFDALRRGQREVQRVTADATQLTGLKFGYAFSGSVGIVLTVPAERLLDGFEGELEETVRTIFQMAQAQSPEDLIAYARRLGVKSIQTLHTWVSQHVEGSAGVSVDWRRGREVKLSLTRELGQLNALREIISSTSEEVSSELRLPGVLQGVDGSPPRFHFVPDDGAEIRGTYDVAIDPISPPQLFRRYVATIRRTETIHYATEKEDVKYHLLSIESVGATTSSDDTSASKAPDAGSDKHDRIIDLDG